MTKEQLWASAWIFLVAWFVAWEGLAFALRRTDLTLSDFVWRLEGTGWTFARYFILAGLIWLTAHMVWGMFK